MKSRRLISSDWFQAFWPIALEEDQNQKGNYANVHGGAREAKPYSNITGSRANIVIVDDPQSAEQANSAAERHTANRIFWTAVQTRLNNLKKDAIVCIMQRLGSASWIMLRLPHEVAPLFREWLATHFPDRAGKVMGIVQSVREGRDNDPGFFTRMKPQGVWADLFRTRFRLACRRAGIVQAKIDLECSQFRRPSVDGQLSLL